MALYSTDKPIAFTMQNAGWTNIFKDYSISAPLWKTANGTLEEVTLYNGRTWFDKNGFTTILLSTILRNYTFRHPTIYDNTKQNVYPSTIKALQGNIYPLENQTTANFYINEIYINVDGNRVATYDVTSLSQQVLKQNTNTGYDERLNPYYTGNSPYFLRDNNVYNIGRGIHLPLVNSDKLFFETNISIFPNFQQVTTTYTMQGAVNSYQLPMYFYGNYSFCVDMAFVYNNLGVDLNAETTPVYFNELNTTEGNKQIKLFTLDNCPKAYYLLFNGNFGFYSMGCDGAVTPNIDKDDLQITSLYQIDEVLQNKNKYNWTLNTGMLNETDMASALAIMQATNVWLYDTANDSLYNVKVTDTQKSGKRSNNKRFESLTFQVEETMTHIF